MCVAMIFLLRLITAWKDIQLLTCVVVAILVELKNLLYGKKVYEFEVNEQNY